ncbi:MAG: hypothetical protein P4L85_23395 [Paludisphaera borealis]|uniref:hypothetical protein n=1 Tax=Paludisphaera borealis TaxID=1387353 RepID=UPI0028510E13|nr:hypothetical protein [Paludisphaera borealis]MDR3622316.1 hypothetical protein [Paludisphaera borealis]
MERSNPNCEGSNGPPRRQDPEPKALPSNSVTAITRSGSGHERRIESATIEPNRPESRDGGFPWRPATNRRQENATIEPNRLEGRDGEHLIGERRIGVGKTRRSNPIAGRHLD